MFTHRFTREYTHMCALMSVVVRMQISSLFIFQGNILVSSKKYSNTEFLFLSFQNLFPLCFFFTFVIQPSIRNIFFLIKADSLLLESETKKMGMIFILQSFRGFFWCVYFPGRISLELRTRFTQLWKSGIFIVYEVRNKYSGNLKNTR